MRARIACGEPAAALLDPLWAAADALAAFDRDESLHSAVETAGIAAREVGADAARPALERLRDRFDDRTRSRERLDLAAVWLDAGAPGEATDELGRLRGPTVDERAEAEALRARAALAGGRPAIAAAALGRAEAHADSLRPDPPLPTTRIALDAARSALDAHLAGCPIRGGHHLLRLLGEGGQGRVWEAIAADGSRRVVAWKELVGGGRLEREARIGGRLRHRHLVDVYGVGVDGDTAWCAMALCDRGALSAWLPLPPRAVVEVGLQVCEALAYANETLGLVHLDLKPDNLLVGDGVVKVADLGIAVVAADGATRRARGTRGYAAPEQVAGRAVDRRTDIWALGVVLAELAGGRRAGSSETFDWVDGPVEPVEAPPWLAPVVARCLADDPADRYARFEELAAALRGLAVDGPGLADVVGAPPPVAPVELVGRAAELERVLEALDRGRIVVLEGPAGVGKSALARAALAVRRTRKGERDLERAAAGLRDAEALRRAIGDDLAAMGEGTVLLDGATDPAIVEAALALSAAAPDVRWLVTSRAACPGDGRERIEVPLLCEEDGHALVVARAAARGADTRDSAAIAALVRRLGGLPLALELAAGRLGVYSAAELAAELDLGWLRSPDADLAATLREVVGGLSARERDLVALLAGSPDGLDLAELAAAGPDALLETLDEVLGRSIVGWAGRRLVVPAVLGWSLRAEPGGALR